ncbi:MFS transporter [Amycolatopsis sp. NBC_01480]
MALLTHRAYWRWSAGVQLARLPGAMAPLAFTGLATSITGSYRLGGVMMAVYVVAETAGALPVGRLLDRIGPARGLRISLLLVALSLAALAIAAWASTSAGTSSMPSPGVPVETAPVSHPGALAGTAPVSQPSFLALIALVALPGAMGGGLSGGFRSLLATTVNDALLPRAVAVDAMLLDGILVTGPAIVGGLALLGPLTPLTAMAIACCAAALLVPRRLSATPAPPRRPRLPEPPPPAEPPGSAAPVLSPDRLGLADPSRSGDSLLSPDPSRPADPSQSSAMPADSRSDQDPRTALRSIPADPAHRPDPPRQAERPVEPRPAGDMPVVPDASGAKVPLARCLPWLACQFTVGLLLSTIEVAPLPLVQRLGAPATAAPLVVAVLCGASIAGSAFYAWRGKVGRPRLFLGGFVVGGTVVAANLGWAGLVVGVVLVGVATGPLVAVASVNMQRLLPEKRRSEGFSLSFTVQSCGFGLGALAVGVLPLWMAPLAGVAAALFAVTRVRDL